MLCSAGVAEHESFGFRPPVCRSTPPPVFPSIATTLVPLRLGCSRRAQTPWIQPGRRALRWENSRVRADKHRAKSLVTRPNMGSCRPPQRPDRVRPPTLRRPARRSGLWVGYLRVTSNILKSLRFLLGGRAPRHGHHEVTFRNCSFRESASTRSGLRIGFADHKRNFITRE
jgi:hypothetical protein